MPTSQPDTSGEMTPDNIVEQDGDIIVRDVELFVGYDPSFDHPGSRAQKFGPDRIKNIVSKTVDLMSRGLKPKVTVGHTSKDDKTATKPSVGDVVGMREALIRGVQGIVGDLRFSKDSFDRHVKSNMFPNRSAEVWSDDVLSAIALTGGEMPGRPLADMRFARDEDPADRDGLDCFVRSWHSGAAEFGKVPPMAHEETSSAPPVSAAPEMFSREQYDAACSERDQFKRQRDEALSAVDEQRKLLEDKEREVLIEQYTRKLEDLAQQGYEIGDRGTPQEPGRFTRMLDRIVDAPDSASEFDFLTSILARTPKRTQIDQTNAEQFTRPTEPDEDVKAKALIRARDRAISEKKPEMFARFLEEELKEVSP